MTISYINSKELGSNLSYDLTKPAERYKYFHNKLGKEIDDIKKFLEGNTFVGFLLAKKGAGKGTYSKMFEEVFGSDRFAHISVGDVVRDVHSILSNKEHAIELKDYLIKNYRGFISLDDAIESFLNYSQDKLITSEFILTIVKREVEKTGRRGLFIDGIPRDLDQISHALFFRDLINFRNDPDFFVVLDVPESVIEERINYRRICPLCNTSKNIKLNPTKFVRYDKKDEEYCLLCDNRDCVGYEKEKLVLKKGDDRGLELIRERLDRDGALIEHAKKIVGIPVIFIPGAVPVDLARDFYDDYELNPEFIYTGEGKNLNIERKSWVVEDDNGVKHHVLMAATVVLSLIKNIHNILFW